MAAVLLSLQTIEEETERETGEGMRGEAGAETAMERKRGRGGRAEEVQTRICMETRTGSGRGRREACRNKIANSSACKSSRLHADR